MPPLYRKLLQLESLNENAVKKLTTSVYKLVPTYRFLCILAMEHIPAFRRTYFLLG